MKKLINAVEDEQKNRKLEAALADLAERIAQLIR